MCKLDAEVNILKQQKQKQKQQQQNKNKNNNNLMVLFPLFDHHIPPLCLLVLLKIN
jgi:hypothetical protein